MQEKNLRNCILTINMLQNQHVIDYNKYNMPETFVEVNELLHKIFIECEKDGIQ